MGSPKAALFLFYCSGIVVEPVICVISGSIILRPDGDFIGTLQGIGDGICRSHTAAAPRIERPYFYTIDAFCAHGSHQHVKL